MSYLKIVRNVLIVGLLIVSVSCTNSKKKKIEGQWERYNTTQTDFKVDTLLQELWNFGSDGTLTISSRVNDNGVISLKENAIFKYRVGTSKLRPAIFIQEDTEHPIDQIVRASYIGYDTNSGTNIIYVLKDDAMAFKGIGTMIYYEFYR
mgnify:CR=1 FL=1